MPFKFSLASVLRFRESIEKREETALQAIQLEVTRLRRMMDELTDDMTRTWQDREKELQKTLPASQLQAMQAGIDAALEAKQILLEKIQTLVRQRDAQMKAYRTAHRERQMLSDLLTQKKNAYELEQMRQQQKVLDDIVAARWQRN
jgi:flagellar export protein FliJ